MFHVTRWLRIGTHMYHVLHISWRIATQLASLYKNEQIVLVSYEWHFETLLKTQWIFLFNCLTNNSKDKNKGRGKHLIELRSWKVLFNPTNLPPRWSCCNLPAVVFSTAITKSLILPKITTAWSYNCYLFLHTLFMVPFWYFY